MTLNPSGPTVLTSVVIATHSLRRRGALTEAIASTLRESPHEVVVAVDNNAELATWVRTQLTGVVVVHHQGTTGASATRNAGARAATGNVLVFLDDDAVARSGWLANLIAPLARPDVMGVGGRVEPIWLGRVPKWMPEEFLWVVGASYRGLPSTAAPVRNVWSENMAVARTDFWSIGGFREGFGKTGQRSQPEDTDFCIRLAAEHTGRTWWYEPSALIGHSVPPDRGTFRFFVRRCYNEGQGKAEIAMLVGSQQGLRDERQHASKTLPQGIRRELRQVVTAGELAAGQRALAIGTGLAAAGLGYLLRQARPRITAP
jgi:glycosyltransferase involved in cell wall biosynthesis